MKSNLTSATNTPSWHDLLAAEKQERYFLDLLKFIEKERSAGKTIYPSNDQVFNALSLTPLDDLKVVILGQDPYHGPGQAHGLAFSVQANIPHPPSLQNIFKELQSDLKIPAAKNGCLTGWARQGVLLLNASLSVEQGKPLSHAQIGWERFTDTVIARISEIKSNLVFLLWGSFAQKKALLIDKSKHHILIAPHPSPLSAHRGFLGCKHFSKTNEILLKTGQTPIDWSLLSSE